MADRTKIEWTDATVNPIRARRTAADGTVRLGWHCEHVSEACRNCYAEAINRDRFGTGLDYKPGHLASRGGHVEIVFADKVIAEMLKWRRRRRVFVCSMTDLFGDFVPDWMIDRLFAAMALARHHTFQVLTKRPARMRDYLTDPATFDRVVLQMVDLRQRTGSPTVKDRCAQAGVPWTKPTCAEDWWPLPNVWLGVTAERQQEADERIPILLATPAAKRFVSIEPLLGRVDFTRIAMPNIRYQTGIHYQDVLRAGSWSKEPVSRPSQPEEPQVFFTNHSDTNRLDWVICGGESGPGARPMHPDWVRSLRDQCAAAGTPFLFKQWGEWGPVVADDRRATRGMRARQDGQIDTDWSAWNPNTDVMMMNIGKARAGRLLDGVEHIAFPEGER